ncbi:hypothetical protein [Janthinobacterium sp. GW458P]|uniref:hypothetical protein n=1 Tax=Janthinobacterium sp. GW458P TaxID=1981504 RepID=UPI0012FDE744|nr:hypothetical protein [Janthinobacterium sp. GW458P]MBE3024717.1 hypothetical protein [Janthinobacterium sp. GW458P]
MAWDLYDGRGTGLAGVQGLPRYFACQMTAGGDEYAQHFTLTPIKVTLLALATGQ